MNELLLNEILIAGIIIFLLLLVWLLSEPIKKALSIAFHLERIDSNPILSPHGLNDWETQAVFNPGAFVDDEGIVHLLYRAIGLDGLSKIGHASGNGARFDKRSTFPVYQSTVNLNKVDTRRGEEKKFNPELYASGGGWGGYEDPRAVRINDKVYMSYTSFEGWHSVRIALTSIDLNDLKQDKWKWKRPVNISPPNEVHKNWVLFPEKINGSFAILHCISPEIQIEYIDNLESFESGKHIKSRSPAGGRDTHWDNWMRGAAAPPIKTDRGWLLLYHAMDRNDPNKYKLGAMLLDINDPTKITFRSPSPILSPEMEYENDWKPGVIYASGAVVIDGELNVYYGGGDKYICAARANLNALLDWLVQHGKV